MPAALGVVAADPTRTLVGLSGDHDLQFLMDELAVGAQFRLPCVQVLVNNSCRGLVRQNQRGFEMDFCVQLAFDKQNVQNAERGCGGAAYSVPLRISATWASVSAWPK